MYDSTITLDTIIDLINLALAITTLAMTHRQRPAE
jgi:hypothetical protein